MKTATYQVAGMQSLVTAVRDTGATQPVLLGGLDYANDLGEGDHGQAWLDHAPADPLHQEAASFHNYMGKGCDNATCWSDTIAPVAAHVPVVTGEFDEDNFDESDCADKTPSTFDATYMKMGRLGRDQLPGLGLDRRDGGRAQQRRLQRLHPHRQLLHPHPR